MPGVIISQSETVCSGTLRKFFFTTTSSGTIPTVPIAHSPSPRFPDALARARGDFDQAEALFKESLALVWELKDQRCGCLGIEGLARATAPQANGPPAMSWERYLEIMLSGLATPGQSWPPR